MRPPHKLHCVSILLLLLVPSTLRAAEDTLLPVPDPASISMAEKLIADIYKPYPPAKPAEQKALALKLLGQAKETNSDPAARYVLLRDAAKFAASNADLETALLAIEQTAKFYQVDATALKTDALRKAVTGLSQPASALELLMPSLKLSDQAMKDGNFALALEAANAADKACRIANDTPMASLIKEQIAECGLVQAAFQSAKPALEKLATAPDDAEANLTAGKFLCFVRNQWDLGLPMLSKGTDEAIKKLMDLDKAAETDAATKTKAADSWWEFAQTQTGINKRGILCRAAYWYTEALPTLTGLNRPLAQKRLDEATAGGRQGLAKLIDLIPLVDPTSDSVQGVWKIENAHLLSDAANNARIETPYEPPAEYDFRIEFTRLKGGDCVIQSLATRESSFTWMMGAWGNTLCGFEQVGGKGSDNNSTTVRVKNFLELNHRYTSLVQIRKNTIRAYLNGKLISELKTDFKDLTTHPVWRLHSAKVLGVGSGATQTIFHSVVVIELSGEGKRTR